MNISVPIGHEVTRVAFSFFNSDEIRNVSVKSITNPVTFDAINNHPTKNGLYDNALGPFEKNQLCATCKLDYFQCPGHFGHIELAVPVYHPLLFKSLFNLLRSTCMYCHRLKMHENTVYRFAARFRLLSLGLVFESMELESLDLSGQSLDQDKSEECNTQDYMSRIDKYVKDAMIRHGITRDVPSTGDKITLINEYGRQVTKEFLGRACLLKMCENCGGRSPALRKEGNAKIFEGALTRKDQAAMDSKHMKQESVFKSSEVSAVPDANVDKSKIVYITPIQAREHLRLLWAREKAIMDWVFGAASPTKPGSLRSSSPDQFFMEAIAVPPTRFRPLSRLGDKVFDHPQNVYLSEIVKANLALVEIRSEQKEAQLQQRDEKLNISESMLKKLIGTWVTLQENVNNFNDSTKNPRNKNMPAGIKQIMEKKEGLFRKHMMGKRVNYAARSVISPDPMLETSEIGIPMVFAKKLTYPEPVTQYNVQELRDMVVNGPDEYPGAVSVEHEDGAVSVLQHLSREQRVAVANALLTPANSSSISQNENIAHVNKKVNRHLRNGDMLLLNRQPTLHKPSIMGHVARILPGEKTIRMHYANCNTYNADFDGDEMNVHFPQNAIAQAEARLIANTNNQYLVPTSGEPLRGLIQDHVVAGVMMTARDAFFDRSEYNQLVYCALREVRGRIRLLAPAIVKPRPLWTGKQIISTLLCNLTVGRTPLNLNSKSQVPGRSWSVKQAHETEEGNVIILDGLLLTGILDKKQFGAKAFGLVHSCYEVYGPDVAGRLLSCLGRLFTSYNQMKGFTCRMDDLVVLAEADKLRRQRIIEVLSKGKEILKEFAFGDQDGTKSRENETAAEKQLRQTIASKSNTSDVERKRAEKTLRLIEDRRLYKALEDTIRSDAKLAQLDGKMKGETGKVTTAIVKSLIPNGLYKPFPENGMQLMTVSGAKGSNVNVTQISCMLGQQELEGRRVPVMVSGKTLPSFRAYDLGPRAGGYITGRFLTGIKPQEYYFHCMAGREGLVDTAVKTARSGYLQRCLIKHLEGLKVGYDGTVRDSADGSIYQFHYGEDALDVIKSSYLKDFKFNAQNYGAFLEKYRPREIAEAIECEKASRYERKALRKPNKYDPALSKFRPCRHLGSVSETFSASLSKYIEGNSDNLLVSAESSSLSACKKKLPTPVTFEALMQLKYLNSLVEPGEAVGLLAAQSIGEPSTQMTLNTFHFAGHGAKNVTLGIPRLREIIMTASTKPKTPQMSVPFHSTVSRSRADAVCRNLSRITLDKVMESATVTERFIAKSQSLNGERCRSYTIRLQFSKRADYLADFGLKPDDIQRTLELKFVKRLVAAVNKDLKQQQMKYEKDGDEIGQGADISKFNESSQAIAAGEEEESARAKPSSRPKVEHQKSIVSDDEQDEMDLDATAATRARKHKQHASYDGPDEDEKELSKTADDDDVEEEGDPAASLENAEMNEDGEEEHLDEEALTKIREQQERVVGHNQYVTQYRFDQKGGEWCEIELQFPADVKKILMIGIVEALAPHCVIHETPGIQKCFMNEDGMTGKTMLTTEGANIHGLWDYEAELDVTQLQSNDIAAILRTYGVEAARQTIVREISGVFAVYGIEVDIRHLYLIADYMTFEGGYKPFNRMGIESSTSPFAKMTFETTFHFLTDAALRGDIDSLHNPSARLVMGKVVEAGTGAFELFQKLE